jgi:arsenate reductase
LGVAAKATDDQILDAMVAHPVLVERPLVETARGVVLARPKEKLREVL